MIFFPSYRALSASKPGWTPGRKLPYERVEMISANYIIKISFRFQTMSHSHIPRDSLCVNSNWTMHNSRDVAFYVDTPRARLISTDPDTGRHEVPGVRVRLLNWYSQ